MKLLLAASLVAAATATHSLRRHLDETIERDCDVSDIVSGTCGLADMCNELIFIAPPNLQVNCLGDSDFNYEIFFRGTIEECYKDVDAFLNDDVSYRYSPQRYDNTTFCVQSTAIQNYTAGVLQYQQYISTVTRGLGVEGVITEVFAMEECSEGSTLETEFFGDFYCEVPCPIVLEVDGTSCSNTCVDCDDDIQYTCTNVHPGLAQTCESDLTFLDLVFAYRKDELKVPLSPGGGGGVIVDDPTEEPVSPEETPETPNGGGGVIVDDPTEPPSGGGGVIVDDEETPEEPNGGGAVVPEETPEETNGGGGVVPEETPAEPNGGGGVIVDDEPTEVPSNVTVGNATEVPASNETEVSVEPVPETNTTDDEETPTDVDEDDGEVEERGISSALGLSVLSTWVSVLC